MEKEVSEEQKIRMEETFRQMDELTGDVEKDFPELFGDEIELDEKQNEYLKRAMVDEFVSNVEVDDDNTLADKRLKRPLFKRFLDALVGK